MNTMNKDQLMALARILMNQSQSGVQISNPYLDLPRQYSGYGARVPQQFPADVNGMPGTQSGAPDASFLIRKYINPNYGR